MGASHLFVDKKNGGGGPSHLVLPLCLWAKCSTIGSPRQGASSSTIFVGEDFFPFKKDLLEITTKNTNLRYFFHHHLVICTSFDLPTSLGEHQKLSKGNFLLAKTQDVWRNPKLTRPVLLVMLTLGFTETTTGLVHDVGENSQLLSFCDDTHPRSHKTTSATTETFWEF